MEILFQKLVNDIQKSYTIDKAKHIDQLIFVLYQLTPEEKELIGYVEIK